MVYYVTHPNLDFSAKVDASSTEKARTVFLDYLERSGAISRRQRQSVRRNMVAKRLERPETVDADIELSYAYGAEEGPTYRLGEPTMERVFEGQPVTEGEPTEVQEYDEYLGMGKPVGEEVGRPGMSPIAKAALRGYV